MITEKEADQQKIDVTSDARKHQVLMNHKSNAISHTYKPSVIWSDDDWGLWPWLFSLGITWEVYCRGSGHVLGLDRLSRMVVQREFCEGHRAECSG